MYVCGLAHAPRLYKFESIHHLRMKHVKPKAILRLGNKNYFNTLKLQQILLISLSVDHIYL